MKCILLAFMMIASAAWAAPVTPLVSGNGFGFAVTPLTLNSISKFYVHPYKFAAPRSSDPFGDGFLTENLVDRFGWPSDPLPHSYDYVEESHVIRARTGLTDYFYFMPFGLEHSAVMLYRQNAPDACVKAEWSKPVSHTRSAHADGLVGLEVVFENISERALVVPMRPDSARFALECYSGSDAWLLLSLETNEDSRKVLQKVAAWRGDRSPKQLLQRELADFERWRVPQPVHLSFAELKLWRQSEAILRMSQSREPNRPGRYNHGLMVAALPEGGWFSPWVRDMSYGLLAFIRMGHAQESRWGVESFFNARPIGRVKNMVRGFDYQVPVVRYFGDGSEETNFSGGLAPIVEFDNWGNVLTMLSEYIAKYGDLSILSQESARGSVYVSARDFIVKPLLGNLDAAGDGFILAKDASAWEADAGSEQHFAYSTAAAIQGLRGFAGLADLTGDTTTQREVSEQVQLLEKGFVNAFVQDGFIHGSQEDNYLYTIDSSVLEAFNFGAIRDEKIVRATLDAMEQLRMPSGGIRRIRGSRQYDKQEFVFSDFNFARNFLRLKEPHKSAGLIQQVVERSLDDHGFIPEMYVSEINNEYPGAIGAPTGSIPMVGFGAGMLILYLQERDALQERTR